jgi:hypothetical protein
MKYEVVAPNDRAYIWSIYRDDDAFVASFNAVFPESESRARKLCNELNGDENKRKPFMKREISDRTVTFFIFLMVAVVFFLPEIAYLITGGK